MNIAAYTLRMELYAFWCDQTVNGQELLIWNRPCDKFIATLIRLELI